jgi:hypothetical protein
VTLSQQQQTILSNSKLQYLVLGGTSNTVTPIASNNIVSSLRALLGTPQTDEMKYGVPISFRVNHLRDNSLKRLQSATSFTTQESKPFLLSDFNISFHTNSDDKDHDTAVDAYVWDNDHPIVSGSDHSNTKYDDNSDHSFTMSGSLVPTAMAGKYLRICISPNGNDTWKFNVTMTASNGYRAAFSDHSLNQNNKCEMTPLPASSAVCK